MGLGRRRLARVRSLALAVAVWLVCAPREWAVSHAAQEAGLDAILARFVGIDPDGAVRELARWSEARVRTELASSAAIGAGDDWRLLALALLHTEAGLLNGTFAAKEFKLAPLGNNLPHEVHSRRAGEIVESLLARRSEPDADVIEWCQLWLTFATSVEQRLHRITFDFFNMAWKYRRDTGAVRLLSGSLSEAGMGPMVHEPGSVSTSSMGSLADLRPISNSRGVFNGYAAVSAERELRRGREFMPDSVEAMFRLGRVEDLVGSPQEAGRLLALAASRAESGPVTRWESSMALVLAARFHEVSLRDPAAAIRAYERAVARDPASQPAAIGLAEVLDLAGRFAESRTVVERFVAAQREAGHLWNPWASYPDAQFHRSREALDALRKAVAAHFSQTRDTTLPFPYLSAPPPVDSRALAILTAPQASEPLVPSDAIRTHVEGVRLDVGVFDGDRPVPGLGASDFVVLDNGVEQRVETVATPSSLNVSLVLDTSHPNQSQLARLTSAARRLVAGLTATDRATALTVADELGVVARNVAPGSRLDAALGNLSPRRYARTALWDGCYAAAVLADGQAGRPYLVLLSDDIRDGAGDNASWVSYERMAARVGASGAVVDAILNRTSLSLAQPDAGSWNIVDRIFGRGRSNALVAATGGRVFHSDDTTLPQRLAERVAAVRQSYVLTFTPANVARGDGWHSVTVKVRGRSSKVKVTTRSGYYSTRR